MGPLLHRLSRWRKPLPHLLAISNGNFSFYSLQANSGLGLCVHEKKLQDRPIFRVICLTLRRWRVERRVRHWSQEIQYTVNLALIASLTHRPIYRYRIFYTYGPIYIGLHASELYFNRANRRTMLDLVRWCYNQTRTVAFGCLKVVTLLGLRPNRRIHRLTNSVNCL